MADERRSNPTTRLTRLDLRSIFSLWRRKRRSYLSMWQIIPVVSIHAPDGRALFQLERVEQNGVPRD